MLAHAVADDFGEAGETGLVIRVHVQAETLPITADPARVRQALANLVANALRYATPGGAIEIRIDRAAAGAVIAVHDDGPGMPPEILARAFERFVRGPDSTGIGLGLAIVADIAAAHGGSVSATSTPRDGTTVALVLPIAGSKASA